jgi:hypothetical protein
MPAPPLVPELCCKHGISDTTFYEWRAQYTDLQVCGVTKLRQLEGENRRLTHGGVASAQHPSAVA